MSNALPNILLIFILLNLSLLLLDAVVYVGHQESRNS